MKKILILGAGRSAGFLIRHLLEHADADGYRVTVADRERAPAIAHLGGHPAGEAMALDAGDGAALAAHVADFDLVASLMPPVLQPKVARICLQAGKSMVSASYLDPETESLDAAARERGVALLTELGLDPGIDLISAMELIHRLHDAGGQIESFESYGSGVPAPEFADANPWRYGVTWNPRNVVMAAAEGARYLLHGGLRVVPWQRIFSHTWPVEIEGVGTMDAYPNRGSVSYRETLELAGVQTLVRGTLRYPGFCQNWHQVVRLGLPDEHAVIADLPQWSWARLTASYLPARPGVSPSSSAAAVSSVSVEQQVAALLELAPGGDEMAALRWLGLFSDRPIGGTASTPAAALSQLLQEKLALPATARDMVILHHELCVRYPAEGDRRERVRSTLVEQGEPGGMTAMARTVGLPAGIAARLLLRGELTVTGCPHPTDARLYRPLLSELEREGIRFRETVEAL